MTALQKKSFFLILIIPVAGLLIYISREVLAIFGAAFFLAFAINPVVEFFQSKGARRGWAILTVYLIIFVLAVLVVQLILPRLIQDLTMLIQRLPVIFQEFQSISDRLIALSNSWHLPVDFQGVFTELVQRGEELIRGFLMHLGQGILNFFSKSFLYLLAPFLAFYISRDYPSFKLRLYRSLEKNLGHYWTRTFIKIDNVFRLYIRGQLLDTVIVSGLLGLGLSILGFEAAFLLGLVAGIFNLIPYFGPVLGAFPVIVFALLKSPWLVVYVIFLFLLVNQIEVMFLAPRIIGANLGLHPLTIVYIILIGGGIGGLLGMVLAVPLGAIGIILIKSLYEVCFGLADDSDGPPDLQPVK
ncbi:MAG: AI-2E family transporter [Firmicutes bacterium]|nr:AI-2E family transporter [Bacillota bacterium]